MGFLDEYEPVEERIAKFWADHPTGRITSKLVYQGEGEYIVSASAFRDENGPESATGWAHENVAQLPPNMKGSALEVCETSAIGRCLANLGYAPKGKRPSREEMQASRPGDVGKASPGRDPAPSDEGREGKPEEGRGGMGEPVSADLAHLWQALWDAADGDKAAGRRAITKANKRTRPATAHNESDITEDELLAAITLLGGTP